MPASAQETLFADISTDTSMFLVRQGFLTDSDVKSIWSKERCDRILLLNILGFPDDFSEDKVSFLTMRSRILLILVGMSWSKWHKSYQSLRDTKCTDEALPFATDDLKFLEDSRHVEIFRDHQWPFIPPKLKEHEDVRTYDPGTILPFIKNQRKFISKGVTRESIPIGYWKDCEGRPSPETKVVVRKLIVAVISAKKPVVANYNTEVRNLQRFRASRSIHRGIMNCLAYVVVKKGAEDEISIIMEEANTDLANFLPYEKATFPEPQNPTLKELLTEAAALAGALDWLHEDIQIKGEILACCHMDLNPRNILIFHEKGSPVGIWKIADFGISAIRTPKQVPNKSNDNHAPQDMIETIVTTAKRYKGPYTAPEIYDRRNEVGRNSDIWSYGCILVDIIASKLTGEASLFSLTKRRSEKGRNDKASHSNDHFYRKVALDEKGALNENVQDWIESLDNARAKKSDLEGVALSDCKKLLKDILVLEPHRPRAHDIRNRLIKALKQPPTSQGAPGSSMTYLDYEGETL